MAVDATVWVHEFARLVLAHEAELTDLDAAIGDADHGTNLRRGLAAAVAELDKSTPGTAAGVYRHTAMTLIRAVGGAAGPLYGTFFLRLGAAVPDDDALSRTTGFEPAGVTSGVAGSGGTAGFARAFRAGVEGVIARGKAAAGDKTMLDALLPAAAALDELAAAGATEAEALAAATEAAESGCAATIPMVARRGRASYLGERSAGHQDPGATSAVLLVRAARGAVR
ncbi:DAK2 domain-containing protein [Nocardia sp. NPDC057668]|uniref:DAK2 domain-containing protein n=1 Tax=Nocardia sp. NPDC057668 TaxID=3346202 RepID=UPI00366C38A9